VNIEQRQAAADPTTKPHDLGCDSACFRQLASTTTIAIYYGGTLSDASMLYFADVFFIFFMPALVGQTAKRIFTKLSHVVDIRCYLRTY